MVSKESLVNIFEGIEDKYRIDRIEFGKVLLVASIAVLVVSVQSAMKFESASQQVEDLNQDFTQTSAIINSDGFDESVEALQSIKGTDIAPKFIQASEAFRSAQTSLNKSKQAEQELENTYESYQWMVLISILGSVSGAAIIYI